MRLTQPRTVVKWTGAALSVLILAAWLLTGWFGATALHRQGRLNRFALVGSGCVTVGLAQHPDTLGNRSDVYGCLHQGSYPEGWTVGGASLTGDDVGWFWLPRHDHIQTPVLPMEQIEAITVPLYIPFALFALPTARLFYRDRRTARWAREGRCVGCGYDLSGVAGPCPECGRKAA